MVFDRRFCVCQRMGESDKERPTQDVTSLGCKLELTVRSLLKNPDGVLECRRVKRRERG